MSASTLLANFFPTISSNLSAGIPVPGRFASRSSSVKTCPVCKSVLNFQKCINLKDKKELDKIRYIFEDPEIQIEKFRQSLKFHDTHQNRYISFLENKIKSLIQENNHIRESMNAIQKTRKNANNNI